MSDVLRAKLSAVRRKSVLVNAGAGTCMAVAVLLTAIGVGMLVDWLWELPYTVRAALLAVDLAMVATLIVREIAWPLMHKPDDEEVALWVEHDSPGLRSRLISAIQLTQPEAIPAGGSVSLVKALVRETEELTAPMDFLGVVKADRLARLGGLATLAVVLGITTIAFGGRSSVSLVERALLVPGIDVPRKTRIALLTPNPLIVARGEPIELRVQATGIIPNDGTVEIRYDADKRTVRAKMMADPANHGQFATKMETVADSFTYRVYLNDGHSVDARVEAGARPSVVAMDIRQILPAYTNLPPVKRAPGDLRLLAGSRLAIHITASKAVRSTTEKSRPFNRVTLHSQSGTVDFSLAIDSADRTSLKAYDPETSAADIPLPPDAVGLSIHLVDDNGLETRDPAVYRIEQIPDAPATVRITFPDRREQLSTAQAQLIVGVEATDDFAIGNLALRYRVLPPESAETLTDQAQPNAPAPDAVVKPAAASSISIESIPFDLHGTPKEFHGKFNFQLNKLKTVPVEHGAVEWWLEAQDTNTVTGPGNAASEHYLTRIGSEAEVRGDLLIRLANNMGQIKEQAENLKQDNQDLGELIQEKVGEK